jgi:GTP-binding protein HflX
LKALIETANRRTERAFLVGVETGARTTLEVTDSLDELEQLAETAGAEVAGRGIQKVATITPATFIGSGKAREFAEQCAAEDIDTVIFDDELSAAQGRNLENIFNIKVLDRTALILDIFAQRARTREGKLQVELALLHHLLPRLTRFWGHLSRQKGGIGMRGEGETQLETDRRKVQERIEKLTEELHAVRQHRLTQREGRQRNIWPLASIVGYTNAGKSTMFNALTGSAVLAEDKLFATLDPTTRRLHLETNQDVLLSDTVGFIRKLPHRLVEAFKATLEEVVQADLLLHVVDASHPLALDQILAVNQVLNEIGASGKPTLMILNKIDRFENPNALARFYEHFPNAVGISAKTGDGFPALRDELSKALRPIRQLVELSIPHEASPAIARLHAVAQVVERDYDGPQARFKARIPPHLMHEFEAYLK